MKKHKPKVTYLQTDISIGRYSLRFECPHYGGVDGLRRIRVASWVTSNYYQTFKSMLYIANVDGSDYGFISKAINADIEGDSESLKLISYLLKFTFETCMD